jgi:hypothetical protein
MGAGAGAGSDGMGISKSTKRSGIVEWILKQDALSANMVGNLNHTGCGFSMFVSCMAISLHHWHSNTPSSLSFVSLINRLILINLVQKCLH